MCFFNSELGRYYSLHTGLVFIFLAFTAYCWQQQPQDLALSAFYYDDLVQYFPYAEQPVIYYFGKYIIWFLPFGGALVWWLYAYMAAPERRSLYRRIGVFFAATPLLMGLLKQFTAMPRPMHLIEFGGQVEMPTSFWAAEWLQGGGALPSVHATCGFVFLALYYLGWVQGKTVKRFIGLLCALVLGFGFGYLRIMQGYHSLSQVLWSLACVWLVAAFWFAPELKKAGRLSPVAC